MRRSLKVIVMRLLTRNTAASLCGLAWLLVSVVAYGHKIDTGINNLDYVTTQCLAPRAFYVTSGEIDSSIVVENRCMADVTISQISIKPTGSFSYVKDGTSDTPFIVSVNGYMTPKAMEGRFAGNRGKECGAEDIESTQLKCETVLLPPKKALGFPIKKGESFIITARLSIGIFIRITGDDDGRGTLLLR